jgi:hypothetical protein
MVSEFNFLNFYSTFSRLDRSTGCYLGGGVLAPDPHQTAASPTERAQFNRVLVKNYQGMQNILNEPVVQNTRC